MPALFVCLVAASLAGPAPQFSDPIPIAETTAAASPALIALSDAVHIFWLTRPPGSPSGTGELRHAATTVEGRVLVDPHRIAAGADTRLAWPTVVSSGTLLYVGWMARGADGVRLNVSVVGADGAVQKVITPNPAPAEEGGRIAMLESGGRIHVAWSQFAGERRRIWYARLTTSGVVDLPARPLIDGDAPALAGGETVDVISWKPMGSGNYTLVKAEIDRGRVLRSDQLSGQVLLINPLPPLPLTTPAGLEVLVPTTERAFRTAGQLYLVRIRGSNVTARLPLSAGRPLADVTAIPAGEGGIVLWAEAVGRRSNSEIFAAVFEPTIGRLARVVRVTYTTAGSLRPSVSVLAGSPVAVWLETLDITRFRLVLGTSVFPRPRKFLLGAPELDLRQPKGFLLFSATVVASVLPYAALYAFGFALLSLAAALVSSTLLAGFAWWQELQRRPGLRVCAFFGLVGLVELPARLLIPGQPSIVLLVFALVLPLAAALLVLARTRVEPGMSLLVSACGVLFIQMTTVLFPWGVRQLTQF